VCADLVALTHTAASRKHARRRGQRPVIMRSDTAAKTPENRGCQPTTPHNPALRIIRPAYIGAMARGVVVGAAGLGPTRPLATCPVPRVPARKQTDRKPPIADESLARAE
jgi:hypothetical protein